MLISDSTASQLIDGYKAGNELVKQLITLATGILALSITFTKDVLKVIPRSTFLLKFSWLVYLFSIAFGIWAMMAFTGMIFQVAVDGVNEAVKDGKYGSSVVPLFAQIGSFLFATVLLISFGIRSLKTLPTATESTAPNAQLAAAAEEKPVASC